MRTLVLLIGMILGSAVLFMAPVAADSYSVIASGTVFGACDNQTVQSTNVCKSVAAQSKADQGKNYNLVVLIIRDVIQVIAFIVGVASIILIIVSGLKMVLAGGDTKALSEAKGGVLGAVIGIMVVALAEAFVVFVLNRLTS